MRYLARSMEVSSRLGASRTLISVGHGGHTEPAQRRARLLRSLRRLASEARQTGQIILLEPLSQFESNTCTTAAELAEVLAELNDPCVLPMCDVVASFVQGETAETLYRLTGGAMAHLHIADSDGRSETISCRETEYSPCGSSCKRCGGPDMTARPPSSWCPCIRTIPLITQNAP